MKIISPSIEQYSGFTTFELENRLGQTVKLEVLYVPTAARDYVFIATLTQQASSFVGKNAEHFAFQLCEYFALEPRRFELIEVRDLNNVQSLWRWRFEWVGHSPLSARGELVSSVSQQKMLFNLLNSDVSATVAAAHGR
jgi:hypothetical protein